MTINSNINSNPSHYGDGGDFSGLSSQKINESYILGAKLLKIDNYETLEDWKRAIDGLETWLKAKRDTPEWATYINEVKELERKKEATTNDLKEKRRYNPEIGEKLDYAFYQDKLGSIMYLLNNLGMLPERDVAEYLEKKNFENITAVRYIKHLISSGSNVLAACIGAPRSGKSHSVIKLATALDEDFVADMENRIIYHPEEFLAKTNSPKLKKGSVLILDEAGTSMPSREWASFNNKAISYLLQTFGHKNFIVFFTTPSTSYLDVHSRILLHLQIKAMGVHYIKRHKDSKPEQYCETQVKILDYNPENQITYQKYLRSARGRVKYMYVEKLDSDIAKRYETISKEYKVSLAEDLAAASMRLKNLKTKKEKLQDYNEDTLLDYISGEIIHSVERGVLPQYLKYRGDTLIFNRNYIMAKHDIGRSRVDKILGKLALNMDKKVLEKAKSIRIIP